MVTEAAALPAPPRPDAEQKPPAAGLLLRGGIIPTPLLAELIRSGATVSEVRRPSDAPEASYLPSAKLAEFVRCRDLTCRFPGCEEPAEFCDLDHTIPYPVGPTHASNLKCLCRKHHLLKTFWTGIGGWADQQLPDGTVVWTAPTGRTYTTPPGSRIFFPGFNTTTAALPPRRAPAPEVAKGLMMPKRRRTRAADHTSRIRKERALNAAYRAEYTATTAIQRNKPPPIDPWDIKASGDVDDEPPPF